LQNLADVIHGALAPLKKMENSKARQVRKCPQHQVDSVGGNAACHMRVVFNVEASWAAAVLLRVGLITGAKHRHSGIHNLMYLGEYKVPK